MFQIFLRADVGIVTFMHITRTVLVKLPSAAVAVTLWGGVFNASLDINSVALRLIWQFPALGPK